MPLRPATQMYVLKLLRNHPASYGLELVTLSQGKLKRGSVYVVLYRLLNDGLVESQVVEDGQKKQSGHRKPRYSLTSRGEETLREWAR